MRHRIRWATAAAVVVTAIGMASAMAEDAVKLNTSNKWRISCSEGANNDGTVVFRITPKGEAATDVTVNIKNGRSENGVAQDISKTMQTALDKKRFHVEVDDGEDVLVKKRGSTPDFALVLVESTVKGPRFSIRKE
jgi:hypothetical protein